MVSILGIFLLHFSPGTSAAMDRVILPVLLKGKLKLRGNNTS